MFAPSAAAGRTRASQRGISISREGGSPTGRETDKGWRRITRLKIRVEKDSGFLAGEKCSICQSHLFHRWGGGRLV